MATKYVRKTGSNSGSSGPFLTIQYGINQLDSGDTLVVGDGIYQEVVTITTPNITLKAENKHGAKIRGTWTNNGGYDMDTHALPKDDPKVTNLPKSYTGPTNGTNGGYVGGGQLKVKANNVTIDGFEIYDVENRGVNWGLDTKQLTGGAIRNCYIHRVYESGINLVRSDEITVENCILYHVSQRGRFRDAGIVKNHPVTLGNKRSTACVFRNNIIYESNGEGLAMSNNASYSGPNPGYIIEDNIVFNVRTGHFYTDWSGDQTGGIVQRNIFANTSYVRRSGNPTTGMNFREEPSNSEPKYPGTAITKNLTIVNNLVIGFGTGCNITQNANMKDSLIAFNTFVNCRNSLFLAAVNSNQGIGRTFAGLVIANNIFYGNSNDKGNNAGRYENGLAVTANNTTQNQVTFGPNLFRFSYANVPNDIVGNPQFVNGGAAFTKYTQIDPNNYKLQAGSPAIDSGTSV